MRALFHASQVWRVTLSDTTYAETRSAGELSRIDTPGLREAFADYFITVASRRGEGMYRLLPAYRQTVRTACPSKLSRYYWDKCHFQDVDRQEIRACDSPVDEAEAATGLAELLRVPRPRVPAALLGEWQGISRGRARQWLYARETGSIETEPSTPYTALR